MNKILLVTSFCLVSLPALAAEVPQQSSPEDVEKARRAIALYDESMRQWYPVQADIDVIECADEHHLAQRQCTRSVQLPVPYVVAPVQQRMEWNRQRLQDQIADFIYPGFGRIESHHLNGMNSRIDYISAQRCGVRGWGLCWQLKF